MTKASTKKIGGGPLLLGISETVQDDSIKEVKSRFKKLTRMFTTKKRRNTRKNKSRRYKQKK